MRLCNPDILIDWQAVPPPKFKKDYEGRLLRVLSFTRYTWQQGVDMPHDGSVCRVTRRFNSGGAGGFDLELAWHCPACDRAHSRTIPESWIAEGKAEFVNAIGLADYAHNVRDSAPPMFFLTSSYYHPESAKMGARANLTAQCAAWLAQAGHCVVAPILMAHAQGDFSIIDHVEVSLRILDVSEALCVLLLDDVRESALVTTQLDYARRIGIPCNQIKLGDADGEFSIIPNPRWWR